MNATDSYYQSDLAWVHHAGYAQHVEKVGPGIVRLLRDAGLSSGARVLDVGCGSGLLARTLRADGFSVLGVDASAAMIACRAGGGCRGPRSKAHPHMLRHACGYALANKGHDINHEHRSLHGLAPNRFRDFWR
jgi:SAM-dependent methyltransferase